MIIDTICGTEATSVPVPSTDAYTEWDEQGIVARAKSGSESAFEQLVERHERKVFRLAQDITRNHQDAEDVVQNALVKAFQNLPEFRGDSSFYTWLVRITVNEALMRMRKSRAHKEVSIDEAKERDESRVPLEIEDGGPNPEQRCSHRQLQEILATTINELAPGYRTVFQLRDVEGLSTKETARALALSSSAVKTRLRRARMSLRGALDNYFRSSKAGGKQIRLRQDIATQGWLHRPRRTEKPQFSRN